MVICLEQPFSYIPKNKNHGDHVCIFLSACIDMN